MISEQSKAQAAMETMRSLATATGSVLALPLAPVIGGWGAYRVYHPRRQRDAKPPADDGLTIRGIEVTTSEDNLLLSGWIVPGDGRDTVIVCHGMGRDKSAVRAHVRMLHGAGYHVVAFDMRNHGESGQDRAYGRMAERFTSDLRDVIEYTRKDVEVGGGKIAILAFSFSTWPALYVLRDPSVKISGVVCDSGPTLDGGSSMRRVFEFRRTSLHRVLQRQPAYGLVVRTFEFFGRRMLAVTNWPPDLDGVDTDLLFISGGEDLLIRSDEVAALAKRYPDASHWVCAAAMHTSGLRAGKDEYVKQVTSFLDHAFGPAQGEPQGCEDV